MFILTSEIIGAVRSKTILATRLIIPGALRGPMESMPPYSPSFVLPAKSHVILKVWLVKAGIYSEDTNILVSGAMSTPIPSIPYPSTPAIIKLISISNSAAAPFPSTAPVITPQPYTAMMYCPSGGIISFTASSESSSAHPA